MFPVMKFEINITAGELVDRLTILQLKEKFLPADSPALPDVVRAREHLERLWESQVKGVAGAAELFSALAYINHRLWVLEEQLRRWMSRCSAMPSADEMGEPGWLAVQIARTNDARSETKQRLNALVGGGPGVDVKHYRPGGGGVAGGGTGAGV
jgi:hypothetical protein